MIEDTVMVTMIRKLGDDCGFTYILSSKDANYVERMIKELMAFCEMRKIEK
jgi:hypothetical protein